MEDFREGLLAAFEKWAEAQEKMIPAPAPAPIAPLPSPATAAPEADPGRPGLHEVSISPETLEQIWALLEKEGHKVRKEAAEPGTPGKGAGEVVIRLLGPN